MKRLNKDGSLAQMVSSMPETVFRRQDLHDTYKRNGGIYVNKRAALLKGKFSLGFMGGKKVYPYIMPGERSVDIDDPKDFLFADMLIRKGYRRYFLDK